jgi:hypothetical protein
MRVCVLSSLSFYPELVEGKERAGERSHLTPKLNIRFNGTKKMQVPIRTPAFYIILPNSPPQGRG